MKYYPDISNTIEPITKSFDRKARSTEYLDKHPTYKLQDMMDNIEKPVNVKRLEKIEKGNGSRSFDIISGVERQKLYN